MAYWALVVPAERYAAERLFAHDSVDLPVGAAARPGDAVLLLTGSQLFGLGQVRLRAADSALVVAYTHRLIDEPLAAPVGVEAPGLHPLTQQVYETQAASVGAGRRVDADKRTWLVSVDLPIEAATAAEAVRSFWSYVYELGPQELPAFVTPSHDELAMQAFVLGAEANQDPEEGD